MNRVVNFFCVSAAMVFVAQAQTYTNHYVWKDSPNTPVAPYTNWATAATDINDAITSSVVGAVIWVTNGTYDTGGLKHTGRALTNRVYIDRAVTVRSVNGPTNTFIAGRWHAPGSVANGDAAVRGVYMAAGSIFIGFTISNCATRAADADDRQGGGIFAVNRTAVISNCHIICNRADYRGGGVYSGSLYDCLLSNNITLFVVGNVYGAGAFNSKLARCAVMNNTGQQGAGVNLCEIYDSVLSGNRATEGVCSGGGALNSTLYGSTLSYNTAANFGGGAGSGSALYGCEIYGNSAVHGGGAHEATLYNCFVSGNRATAGSGGGVYGNSVYGGVIAGNEANAHGGGVFGSALFNCTVISNWITQAFNQHGGGLYNGSATNCIILHNRASGNVTSSNYNDAASIGFSCSSPAPPGPGNIDVNPLFTDPGAGDFRLTRRSRCFNTGVNLDHMANPSVLATNEWLGRDLDGGPRIRHNTVDMGAYELRVPRGSMFSAE